jgi:hypothetical protein
LNINCDWTYKWRLRRLVNKFSDQINDAGRGKFVVNLEAPQNYVQQTPLYHPSVCSGNDSKIHSLPRTLDMKPELFDATNGRLHLENFGLKFTPPYRHDVSYDHAIFCMFRIAISTIKQPTFYDEYYQESDRMFEIRKRNMPKVCRGLQ